MGEQDDAFGVFYESGPKESDPDMQAIFEYEKHYMNLVRAYKSEIDHILRLQKEYRDEAQAFYHDSLPAIREKLSKEPIDDEMRKHWMEHLESDIDKSFEMSRVFLESLTTDEVEHFREELDELVHRRRK
ncbi:hypothetical protein [uncultured Selenomonas sp.]|uniref:hypothetical protein n=1 Tax=uncultured Selenomonas sp. TaxID=159275 RepID=UPI0025D89C8E|nr:hypothetical protein [uncultured Selenomonas sp.]